MALIDKISETLVSTGKDVSKKAKDVSELAKLKIDIKVKEDYVQKQYAVLGETYYGKHRDDEDCEEKEQIFLITEALDEISRMKDEVIRLQGSAVCPRCGVRVPEGSAYCNNCGAKLEKSEDGIFEE